MIQDFRKVKHLRSIFLPSQIPSSFSRSLEMEVLFLGKSNVGKSSLINHLTEGAHARVSSMPGKTRAIHLYQVENSLVLADLPGYGFAKGISMDDQAKGWGALVDDYLAQDKMGKRLLFLLVDSRRESLSNEDLYIIETAKAIHLPIIVIATKKDKLNQSEIARKQKELSSFNIPFLFYSVHDLQDQKTLRAFINKEFT